MQINQNIKDSSIVSLLTKVTTNRLFWIVSFSLLTAVAAQIAVPFKPVPFTLQTMLVLLSGAILGSKDGAYSQLIYLGLGVIGLPVFAQTPDAAFGLARIIGPTGGYLLAFPLAAFLTGFIIEKNNHYITVVLSMFAANILIIVSGVLYLNAFFLKNVEIAITLGGAIFSIWMVVKVFAAASIYYGVKKYQSK